MKKLNDLYPGIGVEAIIKNICNDYEDVRENDLFVCTNNDGKDGHDYIDRAISKGAMAVVISKDIKNLGIISIKVPDANREYPYLCQKFYDYPDNKMKMISVTGSDGKTSTARIIQTLIGSLQAGCIDSNGRSCGAFSDSSFKTIENASKYYDYLDEFLKFGCSYTVVEASYPSLKRNSLCATSYDISVWTNLVNEFTDDREFLDYFKTIVEVFKNTKDTGFCILNRDDQYFENVKAFCKGRVLTYGKNLESNLQILGYSINNSKTLIKFKYNEEYFEVNSPLLGEVNVYNLAAAILCVLTLGFRIVDLESKIEKIELVGRMNMLNTNDTYYVMVDASHTANSISRLLDYVKTMDINRIIVVLGEDVSYNILKVVSEKSNYVIFTCDDPNNEQYINNINSLLKSFVINHEIILERRKAISKAIDMANNKDIVLILGKGVETYHKLGFNDIDVSYQEIVNKKIKNEND